MLNFINIHKDQRVFNYLQEDFLTTERFLPAVFILKWI